MTKEEIAKKLDGREFGFELDESIISVADRNNLVILTAGDEYVCLHGCIYVPEICEEIIHFNRSTKDYFPLRNIQSKRYLKTVEKSRKIQVLHRKEKPFLWTFKTDIPHATFEVTDRGEKFCRGIVFSIKDL